MATRTPLVSLGLPVRNGERYLSAALDSMLCQTFRDFELIICDNASTDQTADICASYVNCDPRIRYFRNASNIGPAANFNRTFELSRGEFFKWVAADDVCEPEFLRVCVEALAGAPDAAMAFAGTQIIDSQDRPVPHEEYILATDATQAAARFRALLMANHRRHGAFEAFGLYRRAVLADAGLFECFCRADSLLFARVALRGRFIRIDQPLFRNRDHEQRSEHVQPSRISAGSFFARFVGSGPTPPAEWWDSKKLNRVVFPEWNLAWQYLKSISAAPLAGRERLACLIFWLRFLVHATPKLARDVLLCAERPMFLALRRLRPKSPRSIVGRENPRPPQLRAVGALPKRQFDKKHVA